MIYINLIINLNNIHLSAHIDKKKCEREKKSNYLMMWRLTYTQLKTLSCKLANYMYLKSLKCKLTTYIYLIIYTCFNKFYQIIYIHLTNLHPLSSF